MKTIKEVIQGFTDIVKNGAYKIGQKQTRRPKCVAPKDNKSETEQHRIFMFVDDTKDFRGNNVPSYWHQIIGRSWESMQIEGKVADEC